MNDHSPHHHHHAPAGAPAAARHAAGHDHDDMVGDFRRRFWISLALTIPVLATSEMVQHFLGLRGTLAFPGDRYVEFAFASGVYFYGGGAVFPRLPAEIPQRAPGGVAPGGPAR